MSRCLNCGKQMQNRTDFCSRDCSDEYFEPEEKLEEDDENESKNS